MCDSLGQPYTKTTKETISGRTLSPTVAYPLIHRDRAPGKNAPKQDFIFLQVLVSNQNMILLEEVTHHPSQQSWISPITQKVLFDKSMLVNMGDFSLQNCSKAAYN